jgi:hypothetical protein
MKSRANTCNKLIFCSPLSNFEFFPRKPLNIIVRYLCISYSVIIIRNRYNLHRRQEAQKKICIKMFHQQVAKLNSNFNTCQVVLFRNFHYCIHCLMQHQVPQSLPLTFLEPRYDIDLVKVDQEWMKETQFTRPSFLEQEWMLRFLNY